MFHGMAGQECMATVLTGSKDLQDEDMQLSGDYKARNMLIPTTYGSQHKGHLRRNE